MTLWFDVSDLCIWNEPQLTGIQRTIANVLDGLCAVRSDVRLFRYSAASRRLEVVRRQDFLASFEARATNPLHPARRFSPPLRHRLGRLVRRCTSEEVALALKDCARDAQALWSALRHRKPAHVAADECSLLPPPMEPGRAAKISPPFFRAGDVSLSMSATWLFARYGEVMARHRATTPIRCINLLYDLIPAINPQWVAPGYARQIALWARQQIANADLVLTISKFQKSEIEKYMRNSGLAPKAVQTIRLGDDLKRAGGVALAPPRHVPRRPFVLCVSTVDVRKNQLCLYHVWRRLAQMRAHACPELVLAGMAHESGLGVLRQIRHDPLVSGLIVHVPDASDAELAWYYDRCLFTAYPSMYEGWGLPIGESLATGRYCIASNATSLTEAGGVFADYFDPIDFKGCLDLVERAIARPEYVKQREDEIKRSFTPHTWRETALQVSRIVDEVSRGHVPACAAHP